ncbi:MFS transporter [Fangia hongkongensis]|uniref:MFS transporter n=1 Tax=Fangia hongkongensis TaxID=270495 RepID=UPI00037DBD46|nr:MFS transporter [Fangia hongkongensis]MBK2125840.1 MFS transporter [Fangia hongkongensis]
MYEKRAVVVSSIGGVLEFFDFTLYAIFAPYISQVFFPKEDKFISLLMVFFIFAIGYLARPLGGVLFGHIADKYGRAKAFSSSILIMALCSLFIALLPGYKTLGFSAAILLLFCRLLQGISLGGEIPNASIFAAEHVKYARRGLVIGFIFMCITLGNVLAGLIGVFLTHMFTHQEILNGMWRVPFLIGFAAAVIAYFLRRGVLETPAFYQMLAKSNTLKMPLLSACKKHPKELVASFALVALPACSISMLLFYPTYFSDVFHLSSQNSYIITTFNFIVLAFLSMVFGMLSDKVSREKVLMLGSLLALISGITNLILIAVCIPTQILMIVSSLFISISSAIVNGVYAVTILEKFAVNIRSTAMSLSYNLGFAIIGGITPLLFVWLLKLTHINTAPYLVFTFMAAITFVAALAYYRDRHFERS